MLNTDRQTDKGNEEDRESTERPSFSQRDLKQDGGKREGGRKY